MSGTYFGDSPRRGDLLVSKLLEKRVVEANGIL